MNGTILSKWELTQENVNEKNNIDRGDLLFRLTPTAVTAPPANNSIELDTCCEWKWKVLEIGNTEPSTNIIISYSVWTTEIDRQDNQSTSQS